MNSAELDFYKEKEDSQVWLVEDSDSIGEFLFSFDKKTVFNFFSDYPQKLSKAQIEIFKKEFPMMAKLKD